MDTNRRNDLTEEELAQVRKAMEEFGNTPLTPVVKAEMAEVPETPVEAEEKPVKKRKKWVAWVAAAVAVALLIGIGYGYWAGLPRNHPNSMAKRKQTVSAGGGVAAVLNDGTVELHNQNWLADTSEWSDMVSVSVSNGHGVGLRSDGTVAFTGAGAYGEECILWTNISAISTGNYHTAGLREDGTVMAAGRNDYGQCNVAEWENIIGIDAGQYFTAGLRSDGTVEVTQIRTVFSGLASTPDVSEQIEQTKTILQELASELEAVRQWKDIIAISAGDTHLLGLKKDGTVVAAGLNDYGQCDVEEWTGIVSIDASTSMSIGVRFDGAVMAVGVMNDSDFPVEEMEQLAAQLDVVAACTDGYNGLYLLYEDGTLYRLWAPVLLISHTGLVMEIALTDVMLP